MIKKFSILSRCILELQQVPCNIHQASIVLFQIAAISEQASASAEDPPNLEETTRNPLGWKSFDMCSVVSATEDLLLFILSRKGQRVRVFLLRDIIGAADAFLDDEVVGCMLNDRLKARDSEVCSHSFYVHQT